MVNRRSLLKFLAAGAGAAMFPATRSEAALPKAKITRVKCWAHPSMNRSFSQSGMLVTVETDIGITGIGEGGSPDLIEDLAGSLIGKNPFEIERIWHHMYMDRFYPPGREKIHGQGALDMALWDIKGKALQLPLYDLLHGSIRTHVECYATTFRPAVEAPTGRGAGRLRLRRSLGRPRRWWRRQFRRGAAGAGTSGDGGGISMFQGGRRHRGPDSQQRLQMHERVRWLLPRARKSVKASARATG